jgi:zinc transporter, ZIP family
MLSATLWGGLAAASLLVGFLLAGRGLPKRTVGVVMGFGAGALISAIAYELVPESVLHGWQMAVAFLLGALSFYLGDQIVDRLGGKGRKDLTAGQDVANSGDLAPAQVADSGTAIYIGTLLDNVPESLILGMGFALGGAVNLAFLVAVFVSNVPEGLAGTLSLEAAGRSHRKVFWMWVILVIVSALCAGLGYLLVKWLPGVDGQYAQAFAAGAMLTMIADAMMPEAFEHGGKRVGLFTVFGFLVSAVLAVMG